MVFAPEPPGCSEGASASGLASSRPSMEVRWANVMPQVVFVGGQAIEATQADRPRQQETGCAISTRRARMANEDAEESFQLGAVCDVEARRWQDYAERWGTDQCDEGPWTSTVVDYVVLGYMVASPPVRVWLALADLRWPD